MSNRKGIYWNDKQLEVIHAKQRTVVLLAGRGLGKTVLVAGKDRHRMKSMPRGKFFLASSTYSQLLTKTLPPIYNKLAEYGFRRHYGPDQPGHYVVGVRPPKEWQTPYQKPDLYKNVITFWNGYTRELLSMDRPDLMRGGSYDGGEIDEALLLKKQHYSRILLPATRGTSTKHVGKDFYKQITFLSSMPWTEDGQYLLDYEEKAKQDPDKYLFLEGTSEDNPLITEEDLMIWEDEMDYLDFQVEVKNMRITRVEKGFYHRWEDDKHTYSHNYKYKDGAGGIEVVGNDSRNKKKAIDCSFDFSGWFNCCTIYQSHRDVERMIDAYHVKQENLSQLVKNICIAFSDQEHKVVNLYGDPRGNNPEAEGDTMYEVIANEFRAHGWKAINRTPKKAMSHANRYEYVNDVLKEDNPRLPVLRVNKENCKNVIIGIKMTGVLPNHKKDKSMETKRDFPQEKATHYPDTVDYYLTQKFTKPRHGFSRRPHFATT